MILVSLNFDCVKSVSVELDVKGKYYNMLYYVLCVECGVM